MNIKIMSLIGGFVAVAVVAVFALQSGNGKAEESTAELSWKTFDEGIALSKSQNKKMLIDVYTDWCSWCKKMDKEVYTDANVKKILSAKFVLVKLNAESHKQLTYNGEKLSETEFASAIGATGYPTTVFFKSDGQPITLLPGYVDGNRFATILTFIGDDHYKTTTFEQYLAKSGQAN
ncbi:MAG: DUF255 domain-containing protein [Ignavibacteriales bacterium]|nr:DUF255 domain-containing protein [Ignavibacteriales bacterium]